MKNVLTIFLVTCLSAAMLAGCSGNGGNGGNTENDAGAANKGGGSSGGKVKLTAIITKHPLTQELSKIKWLQEAEDRAGVDIDLGRGPDTNLVPTP